MKASVTSRDARIASKNNRIRSFEAVVKEHGNDIDSLKHSLSTREEENKLLKTLISEL